MIVVRAHPNNCGPAFNRGQDWQARLRGAASTRLNSGGAHGARNRSLRPLSGTRIQLRQKSLRGLFEGFHSSPSAGSSGLVAVADGHSNSERKFGNVRKAVGEIQNV